MYTGFSEGGDDETRGETRPGGGLEGGELPRRGGGGGGGGGIVAAGGRRRVKDEPRLGGRGSGVTSIAYTPWSISGEGGGARVPSWGTRGGGSRSSSGARFASMNGESNPPVHRR